MPIKHISRTAHPSTRLSLFVNRLPRGNDWDFKLSHIYTITLLNFNMNEEAFDKEEIRHHVQLCDTATHKVFYDKLEFIYVEIAKFDKTLDEL